MFRKFPLLYIAIMYIFSVKDKIVFFMQQFAMLVIALCIAVIICAFSVMNGFEQQIQDSILSKVSAITITPKIGNKENYLESLQYYNVGFEYKKIEDKNIKKITYIRNSYSLLTIGGEKFKVNAKEDEKQTEPLIVNEAISDKMKEKATNTITLLDLDSYNPMVGGVTRAKSYDNPKVTISEDKNFILTMSKDEYKKIFRNENYNRINIDLFDNENSLELSKKLKLMFDSKTIEVKTWQEIQPELLNTLKLQRKIFLLLYLIMFTLLCAIIVSTSIAFFKEKRKDWALLSIMNVIPYSVEKIFFYKNVITFLISTILGMCFGYLLTIYSNEIVEFLNTISGSKIKTEQIFGVNKITYLFKVDDFITIVSFSLSVFVVNFIILLYVLKKENISSVLKGN